MQLDNGSKKILSLLESAGFDAYAVGGCVRDSIMGRPLSDYDITTLATPQQTETVLEEHGIRYIETGIKHGTVTAIIDSTPYEITTFRTDGDYTDNRRPDTVSFVRDIKEDLSRRDFTVNAIAYNEKCGYTDLFGGIDDINKKIIRTVGDPDKRFSEDALRILRALRFGATLGFEIDGMTAQSILENYPLLSNVADERVSVELIKAFAGKGFLKMLEDFKPVFCFCLPWIENMYEKHALEMLDNMYRNTKMQSELVLVLLAILAFDKKLKKNASLKRLKLSNELRDRVVSAQNAALDMVSCDNNEVKRLMSRYGKQAVTDAATVLGKKDVLQTVDSIVLSNEPYRISDLDINGQDIMNEFNVKGREIGDILQRALDLVIDQKVANDKEQIIKALRN